MSARHAIERWLLGYGPRPTTRPSANGSAGQANRKRQGGDGRTGGVTDRLHTDLGLRALRGPLAVGLWPEDAEADAS